MPSFQNLTNYTGLVKMWTLEENLKLLFSKRAYSLAIVCISVHIHTGEHRVYVSLRKTFFAIDREEIITENHSQARSCGDQHQHLK